MNSPAETAKNYVATGAYKSKTAVSKLLVLSILAGMFIAVAGVGATAAAVNVSSYSLAKLIGALVFPTGLTMVLVAGSELFTGNCLILISVLEGEAKLSGMLKNWITVYIGNLIGSIIISLLFVYSHTPSLFSEGLANAVVSTANAKVSLSFSDAFLRGILCNFLVCIAVWISFCAKTVVCKVAGLFLPIMLFVLSGYEHSIANMYYIPAGIFTAAEYAIPTTATWSAFIFKNLLPVTLGNIIGGCGLVALPYWFLYLRGAKREEVKHQASRKKKETVKMR